jgi:hypothetical protein
MPAFKLSERPGPRVAAKDREAFTGDIDVAAVEARRDVGQVHIRVVASERDAIDLATPAVQRSKSAQQGRRLSRRSGRPGREDQSREQNGTYAAHRIPRRPRAHGSTLERCSAPNKRACDSPDTRGE